MIGIKMSWECPSCGGLLRTTSPFWDEKTRKNVAGPESCGCGRKGTFHLLDFEKCLYTVMPKGTKIIDRDGNVIAEYADREAEERKSKPDDSQESQEEDEQDQDPEE